MFDNDAVPQLHAAFDCYVVADVDIAFYVDVVADIAVVANGGGVQNIAVCPDMCIGPNLFCLNQRSIMNEWFHTELMDESIAYMSVWAVFSIILNTGKKS